MMDRQELIEKLNDDEHYYGDFGNQFLSNSDIGTLLSNPLSFKEPVKPSPALVIGNYFHTAILEPDKLKSFKIVKSSSRNTKMYKEISGGEMCLLEHEADMIERMIERIESNDIFNNLIKKGNVEYEVPNVKELFGNLWKGKADVVNHDDKLIIDLKTTSDIDNFRRSARRYNYDSQAYIYSQMFGYEFVFIAIDKKTLKTGLFDCSESFYLSGEDKVQRASSNYDLFFKTEGFDPNQFFVNETL